MKIYQCIHKYRDHIASFEARWGVDDNSSFAEIHDCLLKDGYASVYRLIPSEARPEDAVFFTVWNYARLQRAWARENGLDLDDLDMIRLAQIESWHPDVVYDMSPFVSKTFAATLKTRFNGLVLAWNSFPRVAEAPSTGHYDAFVSNYRPFVEYWSSLGKRALELQPGVEPAWLAAAVKPFRERSHELIHYGQITRHHTRRSELLLEVSRKSRAAGIGFRMFGTISTQFRFQRRLSRALYRRGIEVPGMVAWPPRAVRKEVSPPLFGADLYETIRDSRVAMNTYIDASVTFHSNMRIFEVIGNGALLAAPRGGQYPEGLEEGTDIRVFDNSDELFAFVEEVRADPDRLEALAREAQLRLGQNFSKDRQYHSFVEFVSGL